MISPLRLFAVFVAYLAVLVPSLLRAAEPALIASLNNKEGAPILHLGEALTITATGEAAKLILTEANNGMARRKLTLYLNGIEIPVPDALSSFRQDQNTLDLMAKLTAAKERAKAAQKDAADASDPRASDAIKATAAAKKEAAASALGDVTTAQEKLDKDAKLEFSLVVDRDSENDASRKAWDALLRQTNDTQFNVSIALGVGSAIPMLVDGQKVGEGVQFKVSDRIWWGVGAGIAFLLGCLLFLLFKPHLLREEGNPDYAFSLSRTQMAFWGIIVISSFVGVMVALGRLEHIPAQTLVLMGISVTTGLTASLMDDGKAPTWKADSKRGPFKGFFDDLCIGDNGASFHRVQLLLWTVVLGGFFLWSVCKVISMPEFSPTLLVLMGITNGTYLGFKPQEKPSADKAAKDKAAE